jgi:hypothetical protein
MSAAAAAYVLIAVAGGLIALAARVSRDSPRRLRRCR